jgi:hypothetical protein
MVRKSERRTTRGPKPKLYYTGTLFDKDETYDFKLWDDAAALLADPAPGDVLAGPWEFKEFNGGLQAELRVKPTLTSAAEVPDLAPYLRVSYLSKDAWLQYYRTSVEPLIEDSAIKKLLELILHDWAKSLEYEEIAPGQFDVSRWGSLLGHLAGGPIFLERVRIKAGIEMSEELWMHFNHVLLAHHGTNEWGSPVVPATFEAILVHHLDMLDGRLWQIDNTNDSDFHRGLHTNIAHFRSE